MKRAQIVAGALCVLILTTGVLYARFLYSEHCFRMAQDNFGRVRIGQTHEQVLAILGRPNYHSGECYEEFRLSKDCASEYIYSDPSDLFLGRFYIIEFSAHGQVIGKEYLS